MANFSHFPKINEFERSILFVHNYVVNAMAGWVGFAVHLCVDAQCVCAQSAYSHRTCNGLSFSRFAAACVLVHNLVIDQNSWSPPQK